MQQLSKSNLEFFFFFFFHYVHKAVVGTAKIYQDKLDDEEFALKKFAIY